MQTAFTKQSIVGEIVTVFPKASDLFKANRIDFYCVGNQTVEEATMNKEIHVDELLHILLKYTIYPLQR